MKKVSELLDKIQSSGYHSSGELLTNSRDWHELRQEVTLEQERMTVLRANPAVTLPGEPKKGSH